MKVVILAGGYGTRISEESHLKPKPMIEIGNMPILWHIMKYFSFFGHNEFIICAGYKQYTIKEFFANYFLHNSDVTFDFSEKDKVIVHDNFSEPWKVTVVNTGLDTMTGGRLKRVKKYIDDETFLLTYGDGLSNVNLNELIEFHRIKNRLVTITSIQPEGRFGILDIDTNSLVKSFREKKQEDVGWINGGFMVIEPKFIDYIQDDTSILEQTPFESITKINQLATYRHHGYWQCMDTLRDKQKLEALWNSNEAPWKVW